MVRQNSAAKKQANGAKRAGRPRLFAKRKIVRLDSAMLARLKSVRKSKETESDVIRAALAAEIDRRMLVKHKLVGQALLDAAEVSA